MLLLPSDLVTAYTVFGDWQLFIMLDPYESEFGGDALVLDLVTLHAYYAPYIFTLVARFAPSN